MLRKGWIGALILLLGWACASSPGPRTDRRPPSRDSARPSAHGSERSGSPLAGPTSRSARIVDIARSLLSAPYRYAGSDPSGFDCSGLTSYVFAQAGVRLPRTAERQAAAGRWIAPDELASGDLVFFGRNRGKPGHVGVVVSPPGAPLTMIHASSSRGVIETVVLTDPYWLPRLSFGRRVLED